MQTLIHPFDVQLHGDSFPCPHCGEWLKSDPKYAYTFFLIIFVISGFFAYRQGYRDVAPILFTLCATVVFCLVAILLSGLMLRPVYKKVGGKSFKNPPSLSPDGREDIDKKRRS